MNVNPTLVDLFGEKNRSGEKIYSRSPKPRSRAFQEVYSNRKLIVAIARSKEAAASHCKKQHKTQMATKSITAAVGSQSWKNDSLKEIEFSQSAVNRSLKQCLQGQLEDPSPSLRTSLAELSNNEARKHFRETRIVADQLRRSLLETNDQIKSLSRTKELLEEAARNVRKNLKLNEENRSIRMQRPHREQVGQIFLRLFQIRL